MKVVLKTVTGAQSSYDVEADQPIGSIKPQLAEYEQSSIRLCFKGRVLDDAKTFTEVGIAEGDVLILAGKKVAAAAPRPAAASAPAAAPASSTAPATATPAPTAASTAARPTATAPPARPAAAAAPLSDLPAPEAIPADTIDALLGMGVATDRTIVVRALRAAYGNGDRAVEYIFNGIPGRIEAMLDSDDRIRAAGGGAGAAPAPAPAAPAPAAPAPVASAPAAPPVPPAPVAPAPAAPAPAHVEPAAAPAPAAPVAAPVEGSSSRPAGPGVPRGGLSQAQFEQLLADLGAPARPNSALQRALSEITHFDRVRLLCRDNAEAFQTVCEQMARFHRGIWAIVVDNAEEFLEYMGVPGVTTLPTISEEFLPPPGTAVAAAAAAAAARSTTAPASTGAAAPPSSTYSAPPASSAPPPAASHSTPPSRPAPAGSPPAGGPARGAPGGDTVTITPADREAIGRITAIGGGMWDDRASLVTYIATQKNEEAALNILLDHGGLPPQLQELASQLPPGAI